MGRTLKPYLNKTTAVICRELRSSCTMDCLNSWGIFSTFFTVTRGSWGELSCTRTNSPTQSAVQIPTGDGRVRAKSRTIHIGTKEQHVQILPEKSWCKFFTKVSKCLPGMTLGTANQNTYRNTKDCSTFYTGFTQVMLCKAEK